MSVSKDKTTGKWEAVVRYTDWQGNRKRKHKRGFPSKREALAWERAFLGETHGEVATMATLVEAFKKSIDIKVALNKLKESTAFTKKEYCRRYVEPYFSNVEAAKVTTLHINEWLKTINENSHRGSCLSSGTLKVIRNLLSQIFEYGIEHYGLSINPVTRSDMPGAFTNDKRADLWTIDEFYTFYYSLNEEWRKVLFNTLFWSGLRIGELIVLTPADIGDDVISVVKGNMHIGPNQTKVGTPKNEPSKRSVQIPHKVCMQIKSYIAQQEGLKATDRIFEVNEDSVRRFLTYRAKKLGLPHISPHTLRHSYASHSLANYNDIAALARQLGHKNPKTTLKTYAHMVPGNDAEQAKALDKFVEI